MPADTSFPKVVSLFRRINDNGNRRRAVAEGMGTGGLTVVGHWTEQPRLRPLTGGMGKTALGSLRPGRLLNNQPAAPTANGMASTATNLRRPWRR